MADALELIGGLCVREHLAVPQAELLANRVHHDALVEACCAAWNDLVATPDRITSIALKEWAKAVIT